MLQPWLWLRIACSSSPSWACWSCHLDPLGGFDREDDREETGSASMAPETHRTSWAKSRLYLPLATGRRSLTDRLWWSTVQLAWSRVYIIRQDSGTGRTSHVHNGVLYDDNHTIRENNDLSRGYLSFFSPKNQEQSPDLDLASRISQRIWRTRWLCRLFPSTWEVAQSISTRWTISSSSSSWLVVVLLSGPQPLRYVLGIRLSRIREPWSNICHEVRPSTINLC